MPPPNDTFRPHVHHCLTRSTAAMPRTNRNVILTPLEMCRICLSDKQQSFIDVMGPHEPHLLQQVRDYFRVEITGNDGKSTKLCHPCLGHIFNWQEHIERAKGNQLIVNYLAEKRYMSSSSSSQAMNKRSLSVLNKMKKTTSKKSKKRKRSSSLPEDEISSTSTSDNIIQSPLEPIQQSTSESIENLDTPYESDLPYTLRANEEIILFASTSKEIIAVASPYLEVIPTALSSAEIIPSTSVEIIPAVLASEEIIPSTSVEIIPSTSEEIIPSTSEEIIPSTSVEIIPAVSASEEIIPSTSVEIIPATSAEIIPVVSTPAEIIPSSPAEIIPSTSAEIIPLTSAEIIPATSREILALYSVNETSSAGDNPVWYSMENEITDPRSELLANFNSLNAEFACVFCSYHNEEVMRNVYTHILFCHKHSQPYACLKKNCHSIFPNKTVFFAHYRTHLKFKNTYLCHLCFGVETCPRKSKALDHTHQNPSDLLKCCTFTFPTMTHLVLHKLINHSAVVVTSSNRKYTLQKLNLDIKKTELDNIKIGLDVPGTVPCNQIIKDSGSYKCYSCPNLFNNILEFVEHTKIKHKNLITLKDKGIKLCPLCDYSYFNEYFSEHVEECTKTMKVGDKSLNNYGCVHCAVIYTDISPREMRNHVLYCKSFKLCTINNKLHHKCTNCTFISSDDQACLNHANFNCIYLQLKMRYAMGPDEKNKVIQRMEFFKENTQQHEDENCANDDEFPSNSNPFCNTDRQKLLKFYNYYCNSCENLFFDKTIFCKHLTETGSYCRKLTLVYCQKCLTEFETFEEYQDHLPRTLSPSPPILSIKQELFGQNNYEDDNLSMDIVRTNRSYCNVKVEIKKEILDVPKREYSTYDETGEMLYHEPEQEVTIIDFNNVFACPETSNDIYMECEVEVKPDLNRLFLENAE